MGRRLAGGLGGGLGAGGWLEEERLGMGRRIEGN